jgi:hypothetical protein
MRIGSSFGGMRSLDQGSTFSVTLVWVAHVQFEGVFAGGLGED